MPLSSVSNRLTLVCNESGSWVDFKTDSRGFNNPDDVWGLDSLEIAALGDSFTHGYCVPADRNFVAVIRQAHRATLNLGMSGDGPLLMLATLKEYAARFRPRIVLWCYYEGNDLTDLQIERKSALLNQYLTDGFTQSALARQDDLDRAMLAELPRLEALRTKPRGELGAQFSGVPRDLVREARVAEGAIGTRRRTDTREIDAGDRSRGRPTWRYFARS